ncbi:DMT family transporter [Selenomonas montiformis]|uniref:DMT family transporter n=1 Tax=Selenomonas montiformis TaxID=2652285 RepID=UPI003F987251
MDEATKRKTYFLLAATTIIWGIQPLCIKWLVTTWSPVTITAMRYYLIGTTLLALSVYRGERLLPPRSCLLGLFFMGVAGIGLNNVMQFTGLAISTVTNCTLIAAASPAITAFMAVIFVSERLSLLAWGGIVLSFFGALLIISHGSLNVIQTMSFNVGDILFLLAQVAWTTYSLIALKIMRRMSALQTTGWAGLFGAFIVTGYGLVTGQFAPVMLTPTLWIAFFYTVIFGGVMAMLFWNIGVHNAGASVTSIFQNITPVVGMIGGVLCFGEVIGIMELLGAAAIFGGVYLTTHGGLR